MHTVTVNGGTTTFTYDNAGRLTGVSYANGTSATFGYDAENRVTSFYHAYSGGAHFLERVITRNAIGYKQQENVNGGLSPKPTTQAVKQQSFDNADRLTTGTINGQATTFSFDANGDLGSVAGPSPTVNYAWDCADRLVGLTNGSTVTTFLYDGMGNRIGRISGTTTNYFALNYNAGLKNVLAEVNGTGSVTRYYVWGPAGLVCHIDNDGTTTHYYHADEQGSTLALTSGGGTLTDQFAYQPYGALSTRSGTNQTPYQWLGGAGVRAEATNVYAMARRFYSADQKRFLSSDPVGIDGGANLYAYGNLNPTVYADPYGLWAESIGKSVGGSTPSLISNDQWKELEFGWRIADRQQEQITSFLASVALPAIPELEGLEALDVLAEAGVGADVIRFGEPAVVKGAVELADAAKAAANLDEAVLGGEETVSLYHGSRGGIQGGQLSFDESLAHRRPTHLTPVDERAIYFTDDPARAIQQYATPRGQVGRTTVPRDFANRLLQQDKFGRAFEYKVTSQNDLDIINQNLVIKSQRQAIIDWVSGGSH